MKLIKRYGKHFAVGFAAAGMLLTVLSFLLYRQPISADIWLDGGDEPVHVLVNSPIAANWLMKAGIRLYPNDSVRYNGISIPYDLKLPAKNGQQLVYKPAVPVLIQSAGQEIRFYSGAQSLGKALWENNIFLKISDNLSLPLDTPLDQAVTVSLVRSQPVRILYEDKIINVSVSSLTVGGALAEADISLQYLDYSIPEAEQPIPMDRTIQIVRVREEVLTEERIIPYNTERVSDLEMDVGEEHILQTGEDGVQSSTVSVRYEDGEEVARTILTEWVSKPPVTQRIAYGGNVVVQTFEDMDYWLAMDVRITCYYWTGDPTSHGEWPAHGTIAVAPAWYSILAESQIFVPGYGVGTVLDVCPGCAGNPWIDVYKENCIEEPLSMTKTVYFLPPVPDGFSGELP